MSGSVTSVELTPNEYKNSIDKKLHYRLCILTNALTSPLLEVFSFNEQSESWKNELDEQLLTKEIVAAKIWKE